MRASERARAHQDSDSSLFLPPVRSPSSHQAIKLLLLLLLGFSRGEERQQRDASIVPPRAEHDPAGRTNKGDLLIASSHQPTVAPAANPFAAFAAPVATPFGAPAPAAGLPSAPDGPSPTTGSHPILPPLQ